MDPPIFTNEQEEAIVRRWAANMMKESRFKYLPADLARLMIEYVSDAAIAEYRAQPIEVAKELIWRSDMPDIHNCKCGAILTTGFLGTYGGTTCDHDGCKAYVCTACVNICDECERAECVDHKGCNPDLASIHTCSVCQHRQCVVCYEDVCWECQSCKRILCPQCAYINDNNVVACRDSYGCGINPADN